MILIKVAAALTLWSLLLAGCGTGDTLSVQKEPEMLCAPTQDVRDLYAVARTVIAGKIAAEEKQIKVGKMTVAKADAIRAQHTALRELDFDLKTKIENPKSTLDTAKLIRVLKGLGAVVDALTSTDAPLKGA